MPTRPARSTDSGGTVEASRTGRVCGVGAGKGAEADHGADVELRGQAHHGPDEGGPGEVRLGTGQVEQVGTDPVLAGQEPDGRPGQLGGDPVLEPGDRPAGPLVDQRLGVEAWPPPRSATRSSRWAMAADAPMPASTHPSSATTRTGRSSRAPDGLAPPGVEDVEVGRLVRGSQRLHLGQGPLAQSGHACRRTGRRRCGRRPPRRRRSGRRPPGGCRPASRCRTHGSRGRRTRRGRLAAAYRSTSWARVANPGRAVGRHAQDRPGRRRRPRPSRRAGARGRPAGHRACRSPSRGWRRRRPRSSSTVLSSR